MLQRARERLFDLGCEWRGGIVGQTFILPVHVGELGLEEDVLPPQTAGRKCAGERLSDAGFEVVPALIRRVDPAKTRIDGHTRERSRVAFLPRRAVDQRRHPNVMRSGVSCRFQASLGHELLPLPAAPDPLATRLAFLPLAHLALQPGAQAGGRSLPSLSHDVRLLYG